MGRARPRTQFHTVTYVNLTEVLDAIGYPDLQEDEDFLPYMDWATWGTNNITLVSSGAFLNSIIAMLEAKQDQTFGVDQSKSLERKFRRFVGLESYINLEA